MIFLFLLASRVRGKVKQVLAIFLVCVRVRKFTVHN
jgi:hypothetical protein